MLSGPFLRYREPHPHITELAIVPLVLLWVLM
jgi:hypothetical protein